ncbi:MAG TPA: response regulator [Opitutaceae bacterium]|nr:response regulator [Opitutaceae bacterium]
MPSIIIADDDEGHAILVRDNLREAGVADPIRHVKDGQAVLDFFFPNGERPKAAAASYLLILDIRMPKVDGVEVLRRLKSDPELRKVPVIMLTTTDDQREVDRCHALGCNVYLRKPVDYDEFTEAIRRLGGLVSFAQMPKVGTT